MCYLQLGRFAIRNLKVSPPIWVVDPLKNRMKKLKRRHLRNWKHVISQMRRLYYGLVTSGINMTQGLEVSGSNSVLFASSKPRMERANSTTASCIPTHMPRKGTWFSRANFVASIFPCTPLSPKPPGTRIPSAPCNKKTMLSHSCLLNLCASLC